MVNNFEKTNSEREDVEREVRAMLTPESIESAKARGSLLPVWVERDDGMYQGNWVVVSIDKDSGIARVYQQKIEAKETRFQDVPIEKLVDSCVFGLTTGDDMTEDSLEDLALQVDKCSSPAEFEALLGTISKLRSGTQIHTGKSLSALFDKVLNKKLGADYLTGKAHIRTKAKEFLG